MGLMIITVMVLIVYGMVQKGQNPDFSFFGDDVPSLSNIAPAPAKGGFERTGLGLPANARIIKTTAAEGRLMVTIDSDNDGGSDLVILLDLETGRIVGRVETGP